MPQLMVSHSRGQGGSGQGERGGWDWDRKWMEEVMEDGEGEAAKRGWKLESLNRTPSDFQSQETSSTQILKKLPHWNLNFQGWCSLALIAAVWFLCQVEAPLHPSVLLVGVCWRLLVVCLVWTLPAGCVHALKSSLRPGQSWGEQQLRMQTVSESRSIQYSWTPPPRSPGPGIPLAFALADSLLLCVLQEPLPDPSVPHIKTLICRLESVFHTLEKADVDSEEMDSDPKVVEKLKFIKAYLQKRLSSLCSLVHVQGDFESSVKVMLEGLDGLWAQLEELHTGVTLTKEGSQGHRDLASARTDAENLFAVLGRYRKRLQRCQNHLKDSTQLLQELTWSHTHISNRVRSSSESVWPELLLQSNMEQFDKVQENFLSMEQQTSTFQAHLEGLAKGNQNGHSPSLGVHSGSVSRHSSLHLQTNAVTPEHSSPSASTAVPLNNENTDRDKNSPLSLCERSALQFSSTISRLRKSGRRK
ncbi:uncharacterized protein si:ch211-151h10.2 [Cheilinus undulatus]|uniref:uncharacterized protein si:ch211-151h10.2 n=1 Tax=Cheilinus undulatus TaxID=241271 RepID=UPI001BD40C21|nr:uncharacterized protein si:ch211-151h10.2 [Cheilinus undulatus]